MRRHRPVALALALSLASVGVAEAQAAPLRTAAALMRFESWQAAAPAPSSSAILVGQPLTSSKNRKRRALIGGGIGAGVGLLACTAISTLSNDSADGGLSFCPLDSYLLIGGAGFVVGAAIGWLM